MTPHDEDLGTSHVDVDVNRRDFDAVRTEVPPEQRDPEPEGDYKP